MFVFSYAQCYNLGMKTILHCDANNFYASVECFLNPALKDKFVAVSGNPEKRHGIILAKNQAAKNMGVKTGETIWQARQKCPELICVPPHFDLYVEFSNRIFDIYSQYTDRVQPFGIDECWLDVSGSLKLFGSGEKIADTIRERVKKEIGITVSVGVSFTKVFAKLGSDMKKPDATTVITPDDYRQKVWPLECADMLMIGRRTAAKLNKIGIYTIGDIAKADVNTLSSLLGINGVKLYESANGIENEEIRHSYEKYIPKSVGNSTTLPVDVTSPDQIKSVFTALCEMVTTRMRRYGFFGKGISVAVRYNDLSWESRQKAIPATDNAFTLCDYALALFSQMYSYGKDLPVRGLAVGAFDLFTRDSVVQASIFDDITADESRLGDAVDKIRCKYGYKSLLSASVLKNAFICDGLEDSDFLPFKK